MLLRGEGPGSQVGPSQPARRPAGAGPAAARGHALDAPPRRRPRAGHLDAPALGRERRARDPQGLSQAADKVKVE